MDFFVNLYKFKWTNNADKFLQLSLHIFTKGAITLKTVHRYSETKLKLHCLEIIEENVITSFTRLCCRKSQIRIPPSQYEKRASNTKTGIMRFFLVQYTVLVTSYLVSFLQNNYRVTIILKVGQN